MGEMRRMGEMGEMREIGEMREMREIGEMREMREMREIGEKLLPYLLRLPHLPHLPHLHSSQKDQLLMTTPLSCKPPNLEGSKSSSPRSACRSLVYHQH
jgi:hypothetical protein